MSALLTRPHCGAPRSSTEQECSTPVKGCGHNSRSPPLTQLNSFLCLITHFCIRKQRTKSRSGYFPLSSWWRTICVPLENPRCLSMTCLHYDPLCVFPRTKFSSQTHHSCSYTMHTQHMQPYQLSYCARTAPSHRTVCTNFIIYKSVLTFLNI